jgi:hypothetical protein
MAQSFLGSFSGLGRPSGGALDKEIRKMKRFTYLPTNVMNGISL